jgi:hypothetical protein
VTTTPVTTRTFTASSTLGSATLTGVSAFTGIDEGSTLTGPGIAAGAYIQEVDTAANTITMSAPATASGTTVTITGNRGMVTYQPLSADTSVAGLYNCECSIHWDAGNTLIQKVPNTKAANPQIQIDADLLGTSE